MNSGNRRLGPANFGAGWTRKALEAVDGNRGVKTRQIPNGKDAVPEGTKGLFKRKRVARVRWRGKGAVRAQPCW